MKLRRRFITFIIIEIILLAPFQLFSNENLYRLITNIPNRNCISLDGQWDYIIDPYETGYYDYRLKPGKNGFFKDKQVENERDLVEYNFETSPKMYIPHDWNTADNELLYYEGTVWFRKAFNFEKKDDKRYFLYFGAANYKTRVYINGEYLGMHKGGFTPFDFEVTEKIKDGLNKVVVKVDNKRGRDEVPTVNTDWWNYGGITRDVVIVEEPETFVIDYTIALVNDKTNTISGTLQLDGNDLQMPVTIEIPELIEKTTIVPDLQGNVRFSFQAKPELWSPENPKLYNVIFSTPLSKMEDQVAFRRVEAVGNQIYLNGNPVFLRGVCIHDEAPFRQGRINSPDEARTLLTWAKEMNCNFVRLAHYPHNEYMVREAEKIGLLVWSEIPVYWTISFENKETLQNAKNQLEEMIIRDKNQGAVIIWSMANETPHSEARDSFLTALTNHARSLDDTRLISMAMEKEYRDRYTPVLKDPLMEIVDVVSFNSYIGWYDGLPDACEKMNWVLNTSKPVLVSEFGGGALQGLYGGAKQRWTEEFQNKVYHENLAMFDKMDIAGTMPWILMDFRSPRRMLPVIQDGFNRKGLISNNGIRKKAFYTMKEWYEKKE